MVAHWLATLLVLADHLAAHPAASAAADTAGQDGLPLPQTPPTKQARPSCADRLAFVAIQAPVPCACSTPHCDDWQVPYA